MNVKYVSEQNCYLITNHAVAKNSIFRNKYYCKRFTKKLSTYLSPLCEVIGHCFHQDEFQILVKLKSREAFEIFYRKKYPERIKAGSVIPADTYIFSQAMANLQSSMAIHFNRNENRTGAVFARRFCKVLIQSRKELERWLQRFKDRNKFHAYTKKWNWNRGRGRWVEGYRVWLKYKVGDIKKIYSDPDFKLGLQGQLTRADILTKKSKNNHNPPP